MSVATQKSENFNVEVHQDHLERIIRSDPVNSIAELIWNSLDADATKVYVDIEKGPLIGLVEDLTEPASIQIWVKTWAQIIQENEHRMQFFRKQLDYKANNEYALQYLKGVSDKYLPETIKQKIENSEAT